MLADLQCLACHSLDKESWIVLKDLFVRKWQEDKKFPSPEVANAAASTVSYSLERHNGILKSAGYSGRQKLGLEKLFNMLRFRR